MKLGSKGRFAVVGALATSVSVVSASPALGAAATPTGWRSVGGCASAVSFSWALSCTWDGDDVYDYVTTIRSSGWVWETGVGDAITADARGFVWAVGTQPNGVYFGYSSLDEGLGGLTWTPLPNTDGAGTTITFATVAAGYPEYGVNPLNGSYFTPQGGVNQVWATDTSNNVWAWSGDVYFGSPYSIESNSWDEVTPVPNGAAKVAMQSETFGDVYGNSSPCSNLPIPWAMDTLGSVYQYSLESAGTCIATGTCTGGCWVGMGMSATDISSGDYVLGRTDPTSTQVPIVYQWIQGPPACVNPPCGAFEPLPEQPAATELDGGVQPVALIGLGAATNPANGALSGIDTNHAVWANW